MHRTEKFSNKSYRLISYRSYQNAYELLYEKSFLWQSLIRTYSRLCIILYFYKRKSKFPLQTLCTFPAPNLAEIWRAVCYAERSPFSAVVSNAWSCISSCSWETCGWRDRRSTQIVMLNAHPLVPWFWTPGAVSPVVPGKRVDGGIDEATRLLCWALTV
jgi:hypothetical protein